MRSICKKEVRSLLLGLTGPLMIAVIVLILNVYFIFNNLIALNADIATPLNAACVLALTVAVPFLTMRSFAEETRTKTDQLLLTAPLRIRDIVLGKYLPVALFLLIPVALAALFPLILTPYGRVQYLYSYTALLGFYLYALMIAAAGLFLSALTASPYVSGILTFFVILSGVMLGNVYDGIGIVWLKDALSGALDVQKRIAAMMGGRFTLSAVIYFLSLTALFLFLTCFVLGERMRGRTSGKAAEKVRRYFPVVCALLITVIVNLCASLLPDRMNSIDVTGNGLYSIGEASRTIAAELEQPVTIFYLAPKGRTSGKDENIERILTAYADASEKITLRHIDPDLDPYFYADYSDTPLSLNSVVVINEESGAHKAFDMSQLITAQLDTSTLTSYITGYDAEGQITGALQELTGEDVRGRAYIVTGHEEQPFEEEFLSRFARAGLETMPLDLSASPVPEDAALVVISLPLTDYTKEESARLISYLEEGGSLFFNAYFRADTKTPNLNEVLSFYGVSLLNGVVVETDPEGYYYSGTSGAPVYLFPLVVHDDITADVTGEVAGAVFAPLCQAFAYEKTDGVTLKPLLVTSEEAFLKTDPTDGVFEQGPEDMAGRQVIGLRCEKTLADNGTSRAVLYSSNGIFTNEADTQLSMGMNARLFVNTLHALTSEDASFVYIPPKMFYQPLSIRANSAIGWSVALLMLVPLIVVPGLIVYLRRRHL